MERDPIQLVPRARRTGLHDTAGESEARRPRAITAFSRRELMQILDVYGRKVAAGEWRDYAIDLGAETAEFAVFRRTSEVPIYRIVKTPQLARKQGAFSVVTATGLILKRGHELDRILAVFEKRVRVVG